MNFWIVLLIGIILGWLVEWVIDWFFWRNESGVVVVDEDEIRAQIVEESDARVADVDARWQAKMNETAQQWQTRLNALVQQQQARISALEASNRELQAQLNAGATTQPGIFPAAAVGAVVGASLANKTEEMPEAKSATVAAAAVEEEVAPAHVSTYPTATWRGEYYNNLTLRGKPVLVRDDDEIDFDWSKTPPAPNINPDQFAVRWTRMIDLEKGRYQFSVTADDGARLWVNEQLLVDDWTDHPAKTLNRDVSVPGGPVPVRLEYYENDYDSMIRLTWDRAARSDLTKVRGIGPKFAALLYEGGILTYDDLAAATPEELIEIVQPAEWQRQQIDFASWIAQADAMTHVPGQMTTGDDLTLLEGIGPTYAAKLREGGITTFAQLAVTDEDTLAEIVNVPAWRKLNYSDWIAQARLQSAGDTAGLKALQDELFKKEPDFDNLELIKGIGPKSSNVIRAAGITTFAALAESQPEALDRIMQDAGIPSGDYEAWIDEAAMRASGKRVRRTRKKVSELVSCPQDLSAVAGIGPVLEERLYTAGIGSYWELAESPDTELKAVLKIKSADELSRIKSSAMQLAVQTNTLGRAWDGTPPDDLEQLEGLGEVFERRLYEAGICTYEALAAQTLERLQEICNAPEWSMPNYAAWIATATERAAAKRSE